MTFDRNTHLYLLSDKRGVHSSSGRGGLCMVDLVGIEMCPGAVLIDMLMPDRMPKSPSSW